MRRSVAALLLALALLYAHAGAAGSPALPVDPRDTPGFPADPPPAVPSGAAVAAPGTAPTVRQSVTVVAGWSLVSFPYASVRKVEGLSRMLLRLDQGGFTPVDPVHHPDRLAPGLAYLAWAAQPETMQVEGVPGAPPPTRLHPGWNLLGNPSPQALLTANFTVTRPGGATRLVTETADPATTPGGAWLYSVAGGFGPAGRVQVDLRAPRATMAAGAVGWVFAWTDLDLNWNAAPPAPPPAISSLRPPAAAPGEAVTVLGQGFGERGRGEVTLGGVAIPASSLQAWSDREIRFVVPAGASTGGVVVMRERFPSGSAALQVRPKAAAPKPSSGTLEGRVLDAAGKPLAQALVALENGQQAVAGADGAFRIADVPVGRHLAYVSRVGYRTGSGEVEIVAGKVRSLGVKLSPVAASAPPSAPEKSTTLTVKAWAFTTSGQRVWPKKIEVWESGNSSRQWQETFWEDRGDPYRELRCPGVLVGRSYNVKITWAHATGRERSGRWEPRVWKEDQTESYERPD